MSDIPNNEYLKNIKHILNTEVMQFTRGKTEKTMTNIALNYLANYANNEYTIPIIITNKSLAETEQWKFRLKNQFNNREHINIKVISCKDEADYNGKYACEKLVNDLLCCPREDIPNIIVMCCHPKRVLGDCIKILQSFSVSRRFVEPIKFGFIFDEADKNINIICRFLKKINRDKYRNQSDEPLISDIQYMTATPLKEFWKKISKHGIHELLNIDHYIPQPEHTFEELKEDYKWLHDHNKVFHESESNPVPYIKEVISDGLIDISDRNIIFAPAENTRKTHKAVRELFLGMGYTVLEHNTNKGFFEPCGDYKTLDTFKIEHNIKGELRDVLRKWNELNPTKNLAITGYFTIERGITFNTDGFNFTHMIISKYHMNKMNSLLQLCGRGHGHKDYVDTMSVIMPEEVWLAVISLIENLLELKGTNPDKYNASDFSQSDSTIPIRLELIDEEYKNEIFAMIPDNGFRGRSAQNMKNALSNKLKVGIDDGKIIMDDKNNVNKFIFSERTLKGCRVYKNGDPVSVRRFEGFNKNFNDRTPSAQAGDCDQYNIDLAKDDYITEGFTNPNNIAWITYRK
jgi:hypothetical protein